MTQPDTIKQNCAADNLLTSPENAGRTIVEAGAVIACPLLGTDAFVKFCKERGLSIDRERLIRLERLGLFAPVFRVRTPESDTPLFYIPVRKDYNWFVKKWAWDTTAIPLSYIVPDHKDRTQEAYYSIFQIDYLHLVLMSMTLSVQLDGYLGSNEDEGIDWQKSGERWMEYARQSLEVLRAHVHRRSVAFLCQFISNRYYPETQGDQRVIQVRNGHSSDFWISVNGHDWSWDEEVRKWNPQTAVSLFNLTPERLSHSYRGLASELTHIDPIERWYQLVQFVSVNEREQLKGDALRAETLRAGANMLRLLYKDLYGVALSSPNEVTRTIITHMPELAVRRDARHYLEFVVNRFGLNPQPKLLLIVEGKSEEAVVRHIFEKYFGSHPGNYGIEILVLGGVDVATGTKKEDRFRAILRLVDYLHHHQTITYLILDNENYAGKLKQETRKARSIHGNGRYVTRPEYVRIWKQSFEFDNFSCEEIAVAMNKLAQGRASFSRAEVGDCKADSNPGARLAECYRQKADYDLQKVRLNDILAEHMMSSDTKRKIENRPIIKALVQVARLAALNPFPTTHEAWVINQGSNYLGHKTVRVKKSSLSK